MSAKWLIGFFMLYVICAIVSLMMEAQQLGASEASTLYIILTPDIPAYSNPIGAIFAYISVAPAYLDALWSIFWWDYSFFEGSWQLVRYILFLPLSGGLVVSLVLAFVRGVSSG